MNSFRFDLSVFQHWELTKAKCALVALALFAYAAQCFSANDPPKAVEARSDAGKPWVLVVTYLASPNSGGTVGASFQEFSSKANCETAIQLLATQSKRLTNGWGTASFPPVTTCTPK